MQSDFLCTVWDAAQHQKDNPSTWRGLGRRSTLLRANAAPKQHNQVLPAERVEPSRHCLKRGSCVLASYSSIIIRYSKLSEHHLQSTVMNTSKNPILLPTRVSLSFISQTLRQRLLQAKRPGEKRRTKEEQPIQDKICC